MKIQLRTLSLLSAIGSLFIAPAAWSVIATGDVAIVGVNAQSNGQIAMVSLAPIAAGQTLHFTDTAWTGTGFYEVEDPENPGEFLRAEGVVSYTVGSAGLAAGTVVVFDVNGVISGDMDGSIMTSGNFEFQNDPFEAGFGFAGLDFEQILVYTGTEDFVYGLNLGNSSTDGGWTFDEFGAPESTSELPAMLNEGTTAVNLMNDLHQDGPFFAEDSGNWMYSGITTGLPEELRAAIGNRDFWTANSGASATPFNLAGMDDFNVIPEPSTYAAILGLLTLGLVVLRRRRMI